LDVLHVLQREAQAAVLAAHARDAIRRLRHQLTGPVAQKLAALLLKLIKLRFFAAELEIADHSLEELKRDVGELPFLPLLLLRCCILACRRREYLRIICIYAIYKCIYIYIYILYVHI
jgi:hypothetical protein